LTRPQCQKRYLPTYTGVQLIDNISGLTQPRSVQKLKRVTTYHQTLPFDIIQCSRLKLSAIKASTSNVYLVVLALYGCPEERFPFVLFNIV